MRVVSNGHEPVSATISLSKVWNVLGPFQIGTREATWGADPLESHGGFVTLRPDDKSYPSSLGRQGKVGWDTVRAQPLSQSPSSEALKEDYTHRAAIKLTVQFENVDWSALRAVYGWPALQWQAWVRGILTISGFESITVKIYLPAILEFEIDGERYFGGDYFSYQNAPLILCLEPGAHSMNVRVVRDVRASGGIGDPYVEFEIHLEPVEAQLVLEPHKALFPDFVKGHGLAGRVCCIPVQNTGRDWLTVVSVVAESPDNSTEFYLKDHSLSIAPGQTKTVSIDFSVKKGVEVIESPLIFRYYWNGSSNIVESESFVFRTNIRGPSEPHKMVFRRSNGTVSYALLVPPHLASNNGSDTLPVLAVLHGAGVEAESTQTRDMLESMGSIPAWVIIPTGGTLWSGDDWHTWGLADVEGAIAAIPEYIQNVRWRGPGVDLQNLYIAGHSNGGQGTWHMLTHTPDKICAAAPVSGYLSIQKYVPYSIWNELDPKISGIIHASLSAYRHELLIDNAKGIFIQQQHGDLDDNVPPLHSRRMYQLLQESGSNPQYLELPGKNHWDIDTMATPALKAFYARIGNDSERHDRLPMRFSLVIPSTGEQIGSRGGIVVDQLRRLGQLGRINVERNKDGSWTLKTFNILRFHIGSEDYYGSYPKSVQIDSQPFDVVSTSSSTIIGFLLEASSRWTKVSSTGWKSCTKRSGPQYGTIFAVLRTRSELQIQYLPDSAFSVALQISRNLRQYYSASCSIVPSQVAPIPDGNVVSIVIGQLDAATKDQIFARTSNYPIEICDEGIKIKTRSDLVRLYPGQPELGAIFLVPRTEERLQLVIWGHDHNGAQQAARLFPGLTGVGQPDFVIFGAESPWRGAGAVLAMGFLEHDWTITESAYIS